MKYHLNPTTKKQEKENRKIACANARATMSRKEYKEYISRERCTLGQGLHSSLFETKKYDKKERRRESKRLCKDASYF